jgi:hypothetical protein
LIAHAQRDAAGEQHDTDDQRNKCGRTHTQTFGTKRGGARPHKGG